ncbi:MAG TPA: ABC transporter substrate-binding protein [Clostridia bacterium]|nr:ABC transporter substrate-binding protein [Clostridia bacterium]
MGKTGYSRWAALVVGLFTAWSAWVPLESLGAAADQVRLRLKWRHQFQFAGYYAAQAKGFYRQEGLEVRILEGDEAHPSIKEVLGGGAEFGVSDADLVEAYLQGRPVVVLAAVFQHSPYVLITRADRGIRTLSDLRGRKVMMGEEQGVVQIKAMFLKEGMSLDAIEIVPHTMDESDLVAGRVDAISAYSTVEPFRLRAMGVEPYMIRAVDYGVDFYGDTLFTTQEQIEREGERVAAFRRASLRGWEYAMAHPEEIIDEILKLPGVGERGVTRDLLRREAAAMRGLVLPGLVRIGHMNPGRWEVIARTYAELGSKPRMPGPRQLEPFIYEPGARPQSKWLMPLLASLGVLVFTGFWILIWNLQLRRAVARRTGELQHAERQLREYVEGLRRAKEAVERERAREQAMLRSMTEGMVLFNPEGRLVEMNPAGLRMYGFDVMAALGQPLPQLEEMIWICDLNGEPLAQELWPIFRALRGETFAGYEVRMVRKDGSRQWIGSYGGAPVRDSEGRMIGAMVTVRDVSELRDAEKRLKQQNRRLELLNETAVQLLPTVEPERVLERVYPQLREAIQTDGFVEFQLNQESNVLELKASLVLGDPLLNWPLTRMRLGEWVSGLVAQERKPYIFSHLHQSQDARLEALRRAGVKAFACYPLISGDRLLGTLGFFSHQREAFHPPDTEFLQILANYVAMAKERTRLAAELEQYTANLERTVSERTAKLRELVAELEHMSYSLIHDMRAPLRAIQGFAAIVERDDRDKLSPQSQELLARMRSAASRMDLLITDAFNYNKAVREALPLEAVDTGALLHEIVTSYPMFQMPTAMVKLEGKFFSVVGNKAGLTQCFSNLLSNAVKFVPPGKLPEVRIRCERRNGEATGDLAERRGNLVRIWVEDNGTGIPREGHQRIFWMFQRMHGSDYEGTGIGLALVRKVVERMGGQVGVESEPGQGSRFWIELPEWVAEPAVT